MVDSEKDIRFSQHMLILMRPRVLVGVLKCLKDGSHV